jgi:hypothetical protein
MATADVQGDDSDPARLIHTLAPSARTRTCVSSDGKRLGRTLSPVSIQVVCAGLSRFTQWNPPGAQTSAELVLRIEALGLVKTDRKSCSQGGR